MSISPSRITAYHPEHGVYQIDVYLLRGKRGERTVVAFLDTEHETQINTVRDMARRAHETIEPFDERDFSQEIGAALGEQFYSHPDTRVCLLPIDESDDAGL